ncbi:MAG TPA: dihydrolipoamide acetyltransferase family protein [Acidimicrobiales bacterium]
MPQLGETVTEGTITKWFKAVGDTVARDEPLFEVSTDKVDSEVPSPAAGVLTAILVEEGDTVDVGVALAVIDGDAGTGSGAPAPEVAAVAPAAAPAPTTSTAPAPVPAPVAARAPVPASAPTRSATPVTPVSPALSSLPDEPVPPSAVPPAPIPSPAAVAPTGSRLPSTPAAADQARLLSPVVRKLLAEHDLDPSTIRGTGLEGRITRADVEAVIEGGTPPAAVPSIAAQRPAPIAPSSAPPPPPAPTAPAVPTTDGVRPGARDEVVPFTNIRRRTAEHMIRSKATSAHTLMVREIDYEKVEQVRRAHGDRFREDEGFGLTYLPFVARATVEALAEYPHLNASVGNDTLVVHHDLNLGIAVDLDNEGLIVPVVHNAEELNLRGMARRIRDVADRARTKRLSLDDISGGTFSITNAGPFGTLITGAIINQPQVAILSTDGVSRKPVVVELPDGTESIGIHSVGLVAMNFDHRAVDGAYVARFLARLAAILDDRDWVGEL